MRRSPYGLVLALALALASTAAAQPAAAQHAGAWKLVWSDEFDQPGRPDPARWTYETGFVRNQELGCLTVLGKAGRMHEAEP